MIKTITNEEYSAAQILLAKMLSQKLEKMTDKEYKEEYKKQNPDKYTK